MSLELQSLLPYPNSCVGASPHQQGRDTKMLSFCGIDVSKDRLDVMVLPEEQCCSVPNDASGWAALVERLRNFSIMAIGLEASGGDEGGGMRAVLAAGKSGGAGKTAQPGAVAEGQGGSWENEPGAAP